jgi:hypothetical protein
MNTLFCAFIKNKYLKLSIRKPKPFKNRQTSKKRTSKQTPLHPPPSKNHHTEKPFKTQKPHKTTNKKKPTKTKKQHQKRKEKTTRNQTQPTTFIQNRAPRPV